jgi:Methylmalonyl Co-A mutase-associated GTPase MeaB
VVYADYSTQYYHDGVSDVQYMNSTLTGLRCCRLRCSVLSAFCLLLCVCIYCIYIHQGSKKGIVEVADIIVVNKADGNLEE